MVAVERTDNKIMALHGSENDEVRLDYTGVSRRSVAPVKGWKSRRVRYHNSSMFFQTDVRLCLLPKAALCSWGLISMQCSYR